MYICTGEDSVRSRSSQKNHGPYPGSTDSFHGSPSIGIMVVNYTIKGQTEYNDKDTFQGMHDQSTRGVYVQSTLYMQSGNHLNNNPRRVVKSTCSTELTSYRKPLP